MLQAIYAKQFITQQWINENRHNRLDLGEKWFFDKQKIYMLVNSFNTIFIKDHAPLSALISEKKKY